MSSNNYAEYLTYRKTIKYFLLFLGLWPIKRPSLFYRFLPYIQLFMNMTTALSMLGFVITHVTNILLVTKSAGVMVSFLTGTLKLTFLVTYHKDLHELHQRLDPHFSGLLNNPALHDIVLHGVTTFRRPSLAICVFTCVISTVYIFAPIIFIVHQHLHQSQNIKYVLLYSTVYPWTVAPNGLLYKLHYIFEAMATVSVFTIVSSVEPLYTLYVFQMIGQLREMSHRIKNLSPTDNHRVIIRECVDQYSVLMRCRDILQKIYGPLILWMIATNSITLCAGLFQLSQMKSISIPKIVLFGTYVTTKLTQTFIWGWTGTKLTTESEYHKEAIGQTNWLGNRDLMTSVVLMLTQRPLVLTACNFSDVTVQLSLTVFNTAASYYFLLRTIQEN